MLGVVPQSSSRVAVVLAHGQARPPAVIIARAVGPHTGELGEHVHQAHVEGLLFRHVWNLSYWARAPGACSTRSLLSSGNRAYLARVSRRLRHGEATLHFLIKVGDLHGAELSDYLKKLPVTIPQCNMGG